MKRCRVLLLLLALGVMPITRSLAQDDRYLGIYNLIQQADALHEGGKPAAAKARYEAALAQLNAFKESFPDWNPKVVNYRLDYLAGKLVLLSTNTPSVAVVGASTNGGSAVVATPTQPTQPVNPTRVETPAIPVAAPVPEPQLSPQEITIRNLQEELKQMQSDRALLEAKLREALSARPAAADPKELEAAQNAVRDLQKENELLKFSLEQANSNRTQADPAAFEQTRRALSDANSRLEQLSATNTALVLERDVLQARLQKVTAPDPAAEALREENEILKKQLADLKGRGEAATPAAELERQLREAQTQIATLESDRGILRLEKTALQERLKTLTEPPPVPPPGLDSANTAKVKELEKQRDDLQKRLDAALKQLAANKKGKEMALRIDSLDEELSGLRARIDIMEARKVPYTPEELAALTKPQETSLVASAHRTTRKPAPLPARAVALVAEARQHKAAHELDLAESNYLEIVKLDGKNPILWADLASLQVDLNHLDQSEKSITNALAIDPENDHVLFVLGRLRFEQNRFDDALEAFGRAARINGQDAELQNYIGITLSEKGLRVPAETALRKAIQIDPGYGNAHANLAFIYATQQPPLLELARWHYDRALAMGSPHNPNLEKLLGTPKTSPPAPGL